MATIIFDFDGTLADTLPIVIEMFNQYSGRKPLTKTEITKFQEMTVREVIRELKIPLWRIPSILVQGRRELNKRLDQLVIFKDLDVVLKQLHADGHTMFVVSSNSTQIIRKFLRRYEILSCFKVVRGNSGLFGKGKIIKGLLRKIKHPNGNVFSVADEVRDVEMARKLGLQAVAVSWGFNGPKVLQASRPDYYVRNPSELLRIIQ